MNVIVYRLSLSNYVCTWETEAPGLGAAWGAEVALFSPCPPGAWRGWTRPPAAGRPYPHLPRSCVRTQRSESHGRAVKMKSERLSWFYCWEGVEEAVNVHKLRPHKVAQEWASRQSPVYTKHSRRRAAFTFMPPLTCAVYTLRDSRKHKHSLPVKSAALRWQSRPCSPFSSCFGSHQLLEGIIWLVIITAFTR